MDTQSQTGHLGAWLDSKMNMEKNVNSVCRSCYGQLRQIGHIRQYLSIDATKSVVNSLVTSRIDNCNSLLNGWLDDITQTFRYINLFCWLIRLLNQPIVLACLQRVMLLPRIPASDSWSVDTSQSWDEYPRLTRDRCIPLSRETNTRVWPVIEGYLSVVRRIPASDSWSIDTSQSWDEYPRLTRDRWIPLSREFEPNQRLPLFPWARHCNIIAKYWFVPGTDSSVFCISKYCLFHNRTM